MSLRPSPASWFEVLVLRDDLTAAIDALARSSKVELQSHGESRTPLLMPECREMLGEYDELRQRYDRYWPKACRHETDERLEPQQMLDDALRRLRGWASEAHDVVQRIETLSGQAADLRIVLPLLHEGQPSLDLSQFVGAGPMLRSRIFLMPGDAWPKALPVDVITRRAVTPGRHYVLAVGMPDHIAALEHQMALEKARAITMPGNLPAGAEAAAAAIEQRIAELERDVDAAEQELDKLHQHHDLADAIADAEFVRWYVDAVPDLTSTENFAWITGWTSDTDDQALLSLLADAGVKGLFRLQPPPPGFEPPLILVNPRWMRPFEIFTRMFGVPGSSDVDPTRVVAIVSPLIFGYMFGDVGHGAVLFIAGLALAKRWPALRLLIAGGLSSMVFGVLFGSVFGREDVIAPLWLHPLDKPVLILLAPLAGGAVLLLLGLLLDALQAYWQHKGRQWLETGAGLVLCYLSLLGAFFEPALLWGALAGALWFVLGHALTADMHRLSAIGRAAAEFVEVLLQLGVNTISFVRVGAFSLSHAGLCAAVIGVASAPTSPVASAFVELLGNVVVLGLEGLIVGIQTTRLVLFEFFVRFLHAEGRPFRPLKPPDPPAQAHHRRTT
jgi:V/A-type H+-transporting ATPase subunit I